MAAKSTQRSIGQVLATLKNEFPDISISKIRFLESEGLITPERAPSGYRRYSPDDVERLRYILSVQKNNYLPLKVIREHLDLMDRGMAPPALEPGRPATPPTQLVSAAKPAQAPLRLSRESLLEASGLTDAALEDLERTQIVSTRRGTAYYGREALAIAVAAKRLAEYGIDTRHLRAFKMSADREVGLVEQAIAPHVRRAKSNRDVAAEVTQLVISFHAALVRTAMDR
ncbi:MerR family transcriptional regulator [Microlunatus panaciterrae]|uniref:DNA-binding transcriptional MerR regulator n=1 Tax=Microlunatus panaciterrae TaxID=400768 RepID=A0ABS2RDP5_9ACTN|nr:MerR family transcriptional regulator [Microlunatus panaciterrae]MBM7797109.1 DNA-binding transcriptional MerR regulator [Microlunatus panaciterrae]